jgi:hypothetical protein
MALIQSSDLDFNAIKESLKTYLRNSTEFADYDFEASGLSNILDVLAYNTHLNGLIANVGINESFLGTAQLRSSVVNHAETLGYYPRSRTASLATVGLTINTTNTTTNTVVLPAYTSFSTSVDNISYTFRTTEAYVGTNDGTGVFTFRTTGNNTAIPIKEGRVKTKTFIVGDTTDEQVYVIPDTTIDTATMNVKVYNTTTSSTFTSYTNISNAVRIGSDSAIYIVREAPNGYYEVTFSDGNVLGASPSAGNKIEITYLSTKGADANGATTFVADSNVRIDGTDYTLTTTTLTNSGAGDDAESIASIKKNAPLAFATQQRLVTAEDYKALIAARYSSTVKDVVAWGGNDNVPPIYGRVYISLKFKDGVDASTQTAVKDSIVSQLSANLGIMSIDTVFSDPVDTYLEINTQFNFDPDLTGDTLETTQTNVQNLINNYFTNTLTTFDAVFRRSILLARVDDLSPAILNSSMTVKVQQRFNPTLNLLTDYTITFPVALATPDDVNRIVTSSAFFDENGTQVFFRNKLSDTKLELVNLNTGDVVKDNVGTYILGTGEVKLTGIEISNYTTSSIKVTAQPANQATIKPLRNYILNIDTDRSAANGVLDFQNTAVSLRT